MLRGFLLSRFLKNNETSKLNGFSCYLSSLFIAFAAEPDELYFFLQLGRQGAMGRTLYVIHASWLPAFLASRFAEATCIPKCSTACAVSQFRCFSLPWFE